MKRAGPLRTLIHARPLQVLRIRTASRSSRARLSRPPTMTAVAEARSIIPEWYQGANLYADIASTRVLGPSGSRECFTSTRNHKLASYFFPATSAARALAVLVHGHGCSLLHEFMAHQEPGQPHIYMGSLVEQLNLKGISVAGLDLQGCGFSEGLRCYIDQYEDYVDDVVDFTNVVQNGGRADFAGLPVFVVGESLGGCIALHVCQRLTGAKGAVLIAPMLSLQRVSQAGLNPYIRPLAGLASWLLPTLPVAKTEKNILHPEVQAYFDQDPQTWKGWTRARNAYEYLRVTEELCANGMAAIKSPLLVLHGESDTMTDPDGSSRLIHMSQSTDKELILYKDRWHVLLKEQDHEKVIIRIVEWISDRVAT